MGWFYNMKISAKLFINLGLSVAVAVLLCILGYYQMNNLGNIQDEGFTRVEDAMIASDAAHVGVNLYQVVADSVINRNMEESSVLWKKTKEDNAKLLNSILEKADTENEKKYKIVVEAAVNDFISIYENKMVPILNSTKETTTELKDLDSQLDQKLKIIDEQMTLFSESLIIEAKVDDVKFDGIKTGAVTTNVIVAVVAIVLLFILSIFVIQNIKNPLKKLTNGVEKISEGDLDVSININTKDEIGMMAQAFDKMSDNLNQAMSKIASSAEQVASGSGQVSISGQALSQGSTEQASSIEEITASMTQVAAQTKQNATNANQANELAIIAKDNAVSGNQQMQEMLKAMSEINDSSANISKIIKVIDEIAFQTNILALNAAVEAARAGQHGKGFAVVAEEVRNLAARSANAAKETTAMIEGSIKKVDIGTKIANETANALNKIVGDVAKAADIVGGIAQASNEQATGIAQVNVAIEQVSQVVQTNSATAEESAAASEELSGQAELLKQIVSKFNLKKSRNESGGSFDKLTPDVMRMIESIMEKKSNAYSSGKSMFQSIPTSNESKLKISLTDKEFGKY